jgi:hypothetical protein
MKYVYPFISYISICFELLRCHHQEDVILTASGFHFIKSMCLAIYNAQVETYTTGCCTFYSVLQREL